MLGKAMSYGCIGGGFAAYMKRHSCAYGPMEGISSVVVGAAGSTKLGGSGDGIAASDLICRWSHCCRAGHGGS